MKSIQKNYRKSILWFFLAFCCICACAIFANVYIKANADVKSSESTASTLFLPSSYEQYLELQSPKDLAIDDGHIAIADGNHIYLCDREKQEWRMYTYGIDSSSFGKIQFSNGLLYFTDASMKLHTLDPKAEELKEEDLSYSLSNFAIVGGKLYGTTTVNTTASLYALDPDGSTSIPQTIPLQTDLPVQLPMAYAEGDLYYAVKNLIFSVDSATDQQSDFLTLQNNSLISPSAIAVLGEHLYYTDSTGLYCADIVGAGAQRVPEAVVQGEGFSALTVHGDKLYVLCGKAVREFDPGTKAFTDYEISSTSASVNRLCGAVDTARAGGLLVTADAGNRRVTVYDFASDTYSEILPPDVAAEFSPRFVATDGNIIAAATERAIYTCTYTGEAQMQFTAAETSGDNTVRGIACVYGAVYYVTGNSYGKVGGETVFHDGFGSPAALASDVYGDLYVAYDNHSVVRFTEREFISQYGGVQLDFTLPEDYKSLRADFEGNLYYLRGGSLYCNGNDEALATVRGKDFVYTTPDPDPLSFALGFEDDEVFFLYGSYLVKSDADAIDIPTLNEIPADGVRAAVFTVHAAEGLLVEIPAGTIGIRTDLDALKAEDPAYFPYSSYYRTSEAKLGVLLGVKDGYALVVLYEIGESDRVYTANLFRFDPESGEGLLPTEQYWTPETEPPVRYLSSTVGAYDFPCMHEALRETPFERGAKVLVEGYVTLDEEHVYALVCGTSRTETRGYVPASYLTEVPVSEEQGASFEPAYLKENREGTLFTADDGTTITVTERTRAEFYANPDGTYTARIVKDGKEYRATVSESAIDRGESDALRISLIIILSVLALIIIGVYFFTLPRKRKDT